jgi:hypothetical protein
LSVPDELAQAQCQRCGQALTRETGIKAATLLDNLDEYRERKHICDEATETYEDWDDFRAMSPAIQRELMKMASRALPDLRGVKPLPIPEEAPDETTQWGRPLATLQLSRNDAQFWNILGLVALFVGLMLTIASIAAIWSATKGFAEVKELSALVIGLPLLAVAHLAVGIYAVVRGARLPTNLWLFESGLLMMSHRDARLIHWEDVLQFEVVGPDRRPIYVMRLADDIRVRIAADVAVMPILEYMEIRLCSSQFLYRLKEIWRHRPQRFGIIVLDHRGVGAPRFAAAWSAVRRVLVDSNRLFVDWSKRPDWVPFPLSRVSFPHLILAIASVMIEEHGRFPANAT